MEPRAWNKKQKQKNKTKKQYRIFLEGQGTWLGAIRERLRVPDLDGGLSHVVSKILPSVFSFLCRNQCKILGRRALAPLTDKSRHYVLPTKDLREQGA